jgi:hypothetical protein
LVQVSYSPLSTSVATLFPFLFNHRNKSFSDLGLS